MPIDLLSQIGASTTRPSTPATPSSPSVEQVARQEAARQALPSPGNVLPQGAVRANAPAADVQNAVRQISAYVQNLRRDLQFSVDEESGRTVVKVVDSETGEMIRQIPGDEILAVSRAVTQMMENAKEGDEASKGLILRDMA